MNPTARGPAPNVSLSGTLAWMKAFVREISDSRTAGMAAEMAFWLFLSLIPLAAVAGLVAARVAVNSTDVGVLLNSLPPETRNLVSRQLHHVAGWTGTVGAPAVVVFFWLASGGVHSIFDLLEVKAGASRPWWRKRLIALGTCLAVSIGTVAIGILAAGLEQVLALLRGAGSFAGFEHEAGFFSSIVRIAVGVVTAVGLVAGLYFVGIPSRARKTMPIWPGAILAVALQVLLGYGYIYYLSKVGVYSAYQAGLSIVGVTIALYLFSIALLVGAELNHMLPRRAGASFPRARFRRACRRRRGRRARWHWLPWRARAETARERSRDDPACVVRGLPALRTRPAAPPSR